MKTIKDLAGAVEQGADSAATQRWSLLAKIGFRFAFVFFPIFNAWTVLHFVPLPFLARMNSAFWNRVTQWTAANVLHVQLIYSPLNSTIGSKDTRSSWVQLLCYLVTAAAVTVVWSIWDRRRPNYEVLNRWFRLYLRMVLVAILIPYGAAKLFASQFLPLSLTTLMEPVGAASPMHMLWSFMAASPLYGFFAGAVEVLGGLLLLVPRTTLLGALVSAAAMGNVLMLNLGYDVPVKIFTINLVLMSLLLILPDVKRMADVFLLNREARAAVERPLFRRRLLNHVAIALQLLFGFGLLTADLYHRHRDAQSFAQQRVSTPLYGIWTVEQFRVDGQARPPVLTDPVRWRNLIIDSSAGVRVQLMRTSPQFFGLKLDPQRQLFNLSNPDRPGWEAGFVYQHPQRDVLTLQGRMEGHQIEAELRRIDESQFPLMNSGFHWINEVPLEH